MRMAGVGMAPRARAPPSVDPDFIRRLYRRRIPQPYQYGYPPRAARRGSIRIGAPPIINGNRLKFQLRVGIGMIS